MRPDSYVLAWAISVRASLTTTSWQSEGENTNSIPWDGHSCLTTHPNRIIQESQCVTSEGPVTNHFWLITPSFSGKKISLTLSDLPPYWFSSPGPVPQLLLFPPFGSHVVLFLFWSVGLFFSFFSLSLGEGVMYGPISPGVEETSACDAEREVCIFYVRRKKNGLSFFFLVHPPFLASDGSIVDWFIRVLVVMNEGCFECVVWKWWSGKF